MSATVLSVYNAAISAAGGKGRLSSTQTRSKERDACDIWYEITRNAVHAGAYWPAVKTTQRLSLHKTRDFNTAWQNTDPLAPYKYSYTLPNNYLRAWYLHDYGRFELAYDQIEQKTLLHTSTPLAVLTYAWAHPTPAQWEPQQLQALIWALAAHIVPDVSGKAGLMERNMQLANDMLLEAQSAASTQQNHMIEVVPPTLQARGGYIDIGPNQQFYYPHGSLFSAGGSVNV